MKYAFLVIVMCSVAHATTCPVTQAKDESVLAVAEQKWAQSLESHSTQALGCILAREFEDTGPDGKVTDRAAALAKVAKHSAIHHELSDLQAHVQGDFGYIRGLAAAVDRQGKVAARVRFTDIYVYREGRWQCVAAHESIVAAGAQ
jgi:Domain of unknown function (DUF4440)